MNKFQYSHDILWMPGPFSGSFSFILIIIIPPICIHIFIIRNIIVRLIIYQLLQNIILFPLGPAFVQNFYRQDPFEATQVLFWKNYFIIILQVFCHRTSIIFILCWLCFRRIKQFSNSWVFPNIFIFFSLLNLNQISYMELGHLLWNNEQVSPALSFLINLCSTCPFACSSMLLERCHTCPRYYFPFCFQCCCPF